MPLLNNPKRFDVGVHRINLFKHSIMSQRQQPSWWVVVQFLQSDIIYLLFIQFEIHLKNLQASLKCWWKNSGVGSLETDGDYADDFINDLTVGNNIRHRDFSCIVCSSNVIFIFSFSQVQAHSAQIASLHWIQTSRESLKGPILWALTR